MAAENRARGALLSAKMLVRAVEIARLFAKSEDVGLIVATAALVQPGDEGGLMTDECDIGNVSPLNF